MINERALLAKFSSATPQEMIDMVLHADADEQRVLQIYLGQQQYDDIRAMGMQTRGLPAAPAQPRGNVVVLHGIMGGELTLFDEDDKTQIWLSILHLLEGDFDQLPVQDDGSSALDVRASGILMRYYAKQIVWLGREWNVQPFFFDWRIDIRKSADALLESINKWFGSDAPVNLVAHSMGGLVGRSYMLRHPDRWNKGGRLVMLGTPNYGSFAIPRLLFGANDVLETIAKLDLKHNARDLLHIAKTFPGAYQMLPVRGKRGGLDPLYQAATYTVEPVNQALLDQAEAFQQEIANVIDVDRMVYVAGYNRRTAADIQDATLLGADEGYFFSRKGDGTVPHNLGLLPGVKTFYVDEEHSKLPTNQKVLNALTELIETGDQKDEVNLWKGIGPEFSGDRGVGEESQATMLAAEASRRAARLQQATALRASLQSRGDLTGQTVSPEEQAMSDLIYLREPLPLQVSGSSTSIGVVSTPVAHGAVPAAAATPDTVPPTTIRVHVLEQSIAAVPRVIADPAPIDAVAVGHYLRVKPTGAEHDIDVAISPYYRPAPPAGAPAPPPDADLLIAQLHDRGVLRGDLGAPLLLPDPRPGRKENGDLIAIAGMGPIGEFGVPELSVLARELCWALAQLGKRHLATVMIGSGAKNLSIADTVHGWLAGINRALVSAKLSNAQSLECVTFVIQPWSSDTEHRALFALVNALKREQAAMRLPAYNFDIQLMDLPDVSAFKPKVTGRELAATRISIDFDGEVCRYSALTDGAAIAERTFKVDPRRLLEINGRLLAATNEDERFRLGKFLLEFLFPRDLRAQLTGSAPVVLACNNDAAKMYWELAAQPGQDDEAVEADRQYLGLVRGLTRQLRTVLAPPPEPLPPVGKTLRLLLVADGCREHPLPGAQKEAENLLQLFERVTNNATSNRVEVTALVGPAQATPLDVLLRLSDNPPFDVVHYAGHCFFDPQHPDKSGFLFSGGNVLTANDLERIDRTPKFIFANACQSGVLPSRPDLSSPELPAAFAEAFFKKGVANYICTAWSVGDDAALQFAVELYTYLLGDGTTPVEIYEAMKQARRKIVDTNTWGAYQHYGNPSFRLLRV